MPAKLLTGKEVSAALYQRAGTAIAALKEKGVNPALAMLRVGERPDDCSYEKSLAKQCYKAGVGVKNVILPANVPQKELIERIGALNADESVHGVLIFRPLPDHLDDRAVSGTLDPKKDVDGITGASLAGVFTGGGEGFPPCTARACIEILDFYGINCEGRRAVVIGRSLVVGKPVAMLLLAKNATVTVCHTRTVDLPSVVREAEIVIAAVGKAGAVTGEHLTRGQTVIDVGTNVNAEGKLCGDVAFGDAERIAGAVTPVPGGVGSVTTAVMISNVVKAAQNICS